MTLAMWGALLGGAAGAGMLLILRGALAGRRPTL